MRAKEEEEFVGEKTVIDVVGKLVDYVQIKYNQSPYVQFSKILVNYFYECY